MDDEENSAFLKGAFGIIEIIYRERKGPPKCDDELIAEIIALIRPIALEYAGLGARSAMDEAETRLNALADRIVPR